MNSLPSRPISLVIDLMDEPVVFDSEMRSGQVGMLVLAVAGIEQTALVSPHSTLRDTPAHHRHQSVRGTVPTQLRYCIILLYWCDLCPECFGRSSPIALHILTIPTVDFMSSWKSRKPSSPALVCNKRYKLHTRSSNNSHGTSTAAYFAVP